MMSFKKALAEGANANRVPGMRQLIALVGAAACLVGFVEPEGKLQDPGVGQVPERPDYALLFVTQSTPKQGTAPDNPVPTAAPDVELEVSSEPVTQVDQDPPPHPLPPLFERQDMLQLKGILGWPNRPIALINGQSLVPGDVCLLQDASSQHRVRLHCLEIQRDCVIIAIEQEDGEQERWLLTFNSPRPLLLTDATSPGR